MIDQMMQSE